MERFSVILAGGGGTRFWPLSRQNKPKQFLNLSGKDVMINDTILRYDSVIPPMNTLVVTNKTQVELLNEVLLNDVPRKNILKEPAARNTAACILYSALVLQKRYEDAVMVILPSDHFLTDIDEFRKNLSKACEAAEATNKLITIGIKPKFASVGYGYINYNKRVNIELPEGIYEVNEFVEKPDFEKAKRFIKSGDYLWNSGIFVWKASVIIDNFKRFLPRVYNSLMMVYEYFDTDKEEEYLAKVYPFLQSISIDYAILERSDSVLVMPADFGWSDVGSWDTLGEIFPQDESGNIVKANHIGIETKGSIIYGTERVIATIGVEDLIIADTNDAILICRKDKAQNVKDVVEVLKKKGLNEYI